MGKLDVRAIMRSGAAAGSQQVVLGIIALVMAALLATIGYTSAAYATIYAGDADAAAVAQTAEPYADDVDESTSEGVVVEDAEAIDDDATPMYSGEEVVIEDEEVPMYSGQPGDPANFLRMGIVAGILAVVGIYLILTGRLNRNIAAMERRI